MRESHMKTDISLKKGKKLNTRRNITDNLKIKQGKQPIVDFKLTSLRMNELEVFDSPYYMYA